MATEEIDAPEEGGLARAKLFLWDSANSKWVRGPGDGNGLEVQGAVAEDSAVAGAPVGVGGRYDTTLRTLDAGDRGEFAVDVNGRQEIALPGTITVDKDTTANDSDKTVTVPTGKQWLIISIHVDYAATATSGNRLLRPVFKIGGQTNMLIVSPPVDITASEFWRCTWQAGGSAATFEPAEEKTFTMPLPNNLWLDAADTVRVVDSGAVDVAADDMNVFITVLERDSA